MGPRLDQLAGQEEAARRIVAGLRRGALHHALLLEGPDGVGKYAFARLLAQVLLCKGDPEKRAEGEACGACPGCIKVSTTGHADLQVLELGEKTVITIEQIRDAIAALHIRAREGGKKVLIVRDADLMHVTAQNAFLKTLEEPPGDTHVILTSARPRTLLVTVLSRCQHVPFRPVPTPAIAAMLESRGLPPERAHLIAALSQGSPGRAFEADAEALVADRDEVAAADLSVSPGEAASVPVALECAAAFAESKDKERMNALLALLGVWLRDQIVALAGEDAGEIANRDRMEDLEAAASKRGLGEVLRRARALEETKNTLAMPYNLNPQLALEQLFLAFAGWPLVPPPP